MSHLLKSRFSVKFVNSKIQNSRTSGPKIENLPRLGTPYRSLINNKSVILSQKKSAKVIGILTGGNCATAKKCSMAC